jgi:membrane associated rhomboid family serine protease
LAPFGTCLFHREIKPEEENFLEMLKFTFVPYLQLYTFTFFWLLTVTFVFIYSLYWDESAGFKENSDAEFLKVSQNALFQLGENYPHFVVKQFHLYRMFTSTVLFRNLYHFLVSCSGIAMFASYVEEYICDNLEWSASSGSSCCL